MAIAPIRNPVVHLPVSQGFVGGAKLIPAYVPSSPGIIRKIQRLHELNARPPRLSRKPIVVNINKQPRYKRLNYNYSEK